MKRYEAFITKNWRETGLANVVVARIDDDGGATVGFFLVDHLCLGVKDAFLLDDLMENDLGEIIEERFPEGDMERLHPAWAKKFVEGAVAYADNLGFAPHRDYRKARRALSGIDTSICTETFAYGENGRPHFVQGGMEDEERTARILAALDARLGPDGYTTTLREDVLADPDISDEAIAETQKLLSRALDRIGSTVSIQAAAGIIIAMQCHPIAFSSDDALDMLVEADSTEENPPRAEDLATLGNIVELYWAQLEGLLDFELGSDKPSGKPYPFDFYAEDFPSEEKFLMALFQWCGGFMIVTEIYADIWAELRARPELANYWEILKQWSHPIGPGGLFEQWDKDDAREKAARESGQAAGENDADKRPTLNAAVLAILEAAYAQMKQDAQEK